ncbi:MAG TPA: hypothetical protein VEZ70_07045 [Allosphingosinicella sp.]|nr:hypothetical protein [Allosphingosinicella sp.]
MRKYVAAAAVASLAVSPCLAADIPAFHDSGARQSSATAAAYYRIPLGGGGKAAKAHGGLKLSMTHDYRSPSSQMARVVTADGLDLRLVGEKKPALYLAGTKVADEQSRRQNLGPTGTVVTLVIIAGVAVGAFFLARAINDSGGE